MSGERALDLEVVELLRDEPELLAIADAVAATQHRPRRRRLLPRLLPLAAALAIALALVQVTPWRSGGEGVVERALAAVGGGPVLHAVIEARDPSASVVELASGRREPATIRIEYWFDEEGSLLRSLVFRSGALSNEILQTATGATSSTGPVETLPGLRPALDPALAGFVRGYRRVLAEGTATVAGRGELDGTPVTWLEFATAGGRERVALDRASLRPLLIQPIGRGGEPSPFAWRVLAIDTGPRRPQDFAPPRPLPPAPFRGDVLASQPISSAQARERLAWPVLWLGEAFAGLRLTSLQLQQLSRGYPPETGRRRESGQGLQLVYGDLRGEFVEVQQAPRPEPAYGFVSGRATFDGNPIPAAGYADLDEGSGCRAQLRRDGLYVTVWSSSRELCLQAARALRPV